MFQLLILNVIKLIKAMVETPQEESEFVKWQLEAMEHSVNVNLKKMSLGGKETKKNETNVLMLHVSSNIVQCVSYFYTPLDFCWKSE